MLGTRLLLVDDDPGVLLTLEAVLRRHGYDVTSACNVSEAIHAIAHREFDILVTDLNIGEPGDGFTVVSALRRIQPSAVALIITGFPAFDNALQAIRQQVDDYLVKPVPPLDLVSTIERLRNTRTRHIPLPSRKTPEIVREEYPVLERHVLHRLKQYARKIGRKDLDDAALLDHLPELMNEVCTRVEQRRTQTAKEAQEKSAAHGLLRRQQGLNAAFILNEASYVRDAILQVIHQHLLNVDMSNLLVDLATMNESLDDQLNIAMETLIRGEMAA